MIADTANPEPKWRRLPEERPRQIIEAALEVFSEHGLAAARLEDIAKLAGVSKGTIYLYFPNKEALFSEMVREMVGESITSAQIRIASGTDSRCFPCTFRNARASPILIPAMRLQAPRRMPLRKTTPGWKVRR